MDISLVEYAQRNGKEASTVRQKALRGGFKTARKIGRNWVIDEDEPYCDNRLRAEDIFTPEADTLDDSERELILKYEQAKEDSGWRRYPDICNAIFSNIPDDWYDRYTAEQLGEIAALLKMVYDKGRYDKQCDR